MTIERWRGNAQGRNHAVRHGGVVYTVARQNWPQRACVGAPLAGDALVEIVVTATATR
jgi:hypothetical protein